MSSLILSRLFKWAFFLIIIGAIGNIISQITLKPFEINITSVGWLTFGNPGIEVTARRNINGDTNAPDTLIQFAVNKTDTSVEESGGYSSSEDHFNYGRERLKKQIKKLQLEGKQIHLDTQITLMGQLDISENSGPTFMTLDTLNSGKIAFVEKITNLKTNKITTHIIDAFHDTSRKIHAALRVSHSKSNF